MKGYVYPSNATPLTDSQLAVVALASDRSLKVTVVSGGGGSTAATTVTTSEVTVDTSSAALSGVYPLGVQLYADDTNTVTIFLGGEAVTTSGATRGMPLAPGSFYTPPDSIQDLSKLFAVAASNSQKLVILGVV